MPETFGKRHKTLGKWFAECNTRRTALVKNSDGKANFAECLLSDTRQSLLPNARHLAKLKPKKTRKNGNFYPKKMNFMATWPARFEPETSRCARTSSTTTPHSHLCLDSVLVPIYYTKPSVNYMFEALNEFK